MTDWKPQVMKPGGPGRFNFTLTLGESRWEEFQIWLDGDEKRRLYPGASPGMVLGPDEDAEGTWVINGHPYGILAGETGQIADHANAGDSESTNVDADSHSMLAKPEEMIVTPDTGEAGARYIVTLKIAGKYRTVDWMKQS